MKLSVIDDGLALVVHYYEQVVEYLDSQNLATAARRKVARRTILDDYIESRDIRAVAMTHRVSVSLVNGILRRAVLAARAVENGTLEHQGLRTTVTLTLPRLPMALIRDIDAWATMRGKSRREAAMELLRIGLEATAKRHVRD